MLISGVGANSLEQAGVAATSVDAFVAALQ